MEGARHPGTVFKKLGHTDYNVYFCNFAVDVNLLKLHYNIGISNFLLCTLSSIHLFSINFTIINY